MKILCYIPAVLVLAFVAVSVFPSISIALNLNETKSGIAIGASMFVWAINMIVYLKRSVA